MLYSFALQNFQSFRAPVRISLELNRHVPQDERSVASDFGARLSKAVAVIGANASGKTSLIKSLVFVDWFVKHSFHAKPDDSIPVSAHFSDPDLPSTFEVEFEWDARVWRYQLIASSQRVYHESLHVKHSRAYSYVFIRDWDKQTNGYVVKQQGFGLPPKEAQRVRENASLISTAAQYKVELALTLVSVNVLTNIHGLGRETVNHDQVFRAAAFYAEHEPIRDRMSMLLRNWDLGLADIRLEKRSVTRDSGQIEDLHIPFGIHRIAGKEHPLLLLQESSGTQGAFILLSRILPALEQGGLVVIDELEADLHPHMLTPILDLFFSPRTNPHHAQIVFTCQSMEVFSLLHKAQVVLVEKDSSCESTAWRLDTVKGVRADDNLYAKYMAGAYGAIPRL